MPRRYQLRKRAEKQEETRRRIARAVYELHASVGPAYSTVTAIAERAGVDRVTVYRHFPDDLSLYKACLKHWSTEIPLPDERAWTQIDDPRARLRLALSEVYAHYEANEGLWANGWRDIPKLPLLMEADAPVFAHFERMRAALVEGWGPAVGDRPRVAAWIGHVLEFPTWQSLVRRQGLTTDEVIDAALRTTDCLFASQREG